MTEIKAGEMAEGVLNDEMIEGMRKKIGLKMRLTGYINNEEASRGAIRIRCKDTIWSDCGSALLGMECLCWGADGVAWVGWFPRWNRRGVL